MCESHSAFDASGGVGNTFRFTGYAAVFEIEEETQQVVSSSGDDETGLSILKNILEVCKQLGVIVDVEYNCYDV